MSVQTPPQRPDPKLAGLPREDIALTPRYVPSPTVEDFILAAASGDPEILRLLICIASRGEGKALQVDTPVLTPTGWVKAGDVRPGDDLVAVDGVATKVLGVYPQPVQPMWQVQFSDGTATTVSEDHLWGIGDDGARVVSAREIRAKIDSGAWKNGGRWRIPLTAPVQFPAQSVPLDPYLLGVLLGDGSFCSESVRLSNPDFEVVQMAEASLPSGASMKRIGRKEIDYGFRGLIGHLRGLGLQGRHSWDKFVPAVYLWNDAPSRLAILQGLLDTDGTVLKHSNSVSYSTTSPHLAENVVFLVQSLGGLAPVRMRHTYYTYKGQRLAGRPSYHVSIRLPNGIAPFRLSRKAALVYPKGERNRPKRYIVDVIPAGEGASVCFQVAHPRALYVTRDFIVTHNTTGGIYACLAMAEWMRTMGLEALLPIRVAVVRDTFSNLKRTTLQSFEETQQRGCPLEFLDQQHEAVIAIDGEPLVHFFFFGMDSRKDADKFQGFQCGVLWLEEVAPAAGVEAGIPIETLGVGVTSLRQAGVPRRVLITMNPPDEEHWSMTLEDKLIEQGIEEDIQVKMFAIAPGEKSEHFRAQAARASGGATSEAWQRAARVFDSYRRTNEAFLTAIGRTDLVDRLVKGKVGEVTLGESVVPTFKRLYHTTKQWFGLVPGRPITRSWDGGGSPSTVYYQTLANGNINVFASRMSENSAMGQHILNAVLPLQQQFKIRDIAIKTGGYGETSWRGYPFRDIGDPALGKINEHTKSEETSAWEIESMLKTTLEFGPVAWDPRREALRMNFFMPGIGDRMKILIYEPECKDLVKSLAGRAHYPKMANGRVVYTVEAAKRASGRWLQELDSLGYGLAVEHPADRLLEQQRQREGAQREHKRPAHWMAR